MVEQAFILAAGKGERMRPYTDTCPKPMLQVKHKPLLGYLLDALETLPQLKKVIINTSYLAHHITDFVSTQRRSFDIHISHEEAPLETGGGLVHAKHLINQHAPLLCISGDSYWSPQPSLLPALSAAFNPTTMDFLISLQDKNTIHGGIGDYFFHHNMPERAVHKNGTYMFTSLRILKPSLFWQKPNTSWSQLDLLDACQAQKRLAGFEMTGWHHVSTPQDLDRLNAD